MLTNVGATLLADIHHQSCKVNKSSISLHVGLDGWLPVTGYQPAQV